MPTYEYACTSCGNTWEELQKITEPALDTCPACKKATAKRQISGGSFILKGGGWYADAYSTPKGSKGGDSSSKSSDSGGSASSSSESKGDGGGSKSESKSESSGSKKESTAPAASTPSSSSSGGSSSGSGGSSGPAKAST